MKLPIFFALAIFCSQWSASASAAERALSPMTYDDLQNSKIDIEMCDIKNTKSQGITISLITENPHEVDYVPTYLRLCDYGKKGTGEDICSVYNLNEVFGKRKIFATGIKSSAANLKLIAYEDGNPITFNFKFNGLNLSLVKK
jgi:hypothetical protein